MMSEHKVVAPASSSQAAKPVQDIVSTGLTGDEARARLEKDGPNAMPDISAHPLRNALAKFWAPVPWLLEASIVLEVALHKYSEAAVIAALLSSMRRSPTFRRVARTPPWRLSSRVSP